MKEECQEFNLTGDLGLRCYPDDDNEEEKRRRSSTKEIVTNCYLIKSRRQLGEGGSSRKINEWNRLLRKKSNDLKVSENDSHFRRSSCGTEDRDENEEDDKKAEGCSINDEESTKIRSSYEDVFRLLKRRISNSFIEASLLCGGHSTKKEESKDDQLSLTEAQQTIKILEGKLNIYKELLYAKYKASQVLLTQLLETTYNRKQFENEIESQIEDGQKELSALQFQLHLSEDNLTDAQSLWLERFNRLNKEANELSANLENQNDIIRNLSRKNSVLKREKAELIALQDAKEIINYFRSISSEEENDKKNNSTPIELAILGACKCSNSSRCIAPCSCAKSASAKQIKLIVLQTNLEEMKDKNDENRRLAQLYRDAFEEQLKRNKSLTKRCLLKDCDNDFLSKCKKSTNGLLRVRSKQGNQSEAINSLVELVCERTDALLEEQLLAKALSQRITQLEEKIYSKKY